MKRNPVLFPVLLTYFIDNFGLAIVYPIFSPLFLEPQATLLGIQTTLLDKTILLGLLIASFPLAQFFGAPLLGSLSDHIGRKKVFLMTISGGILAYLLTGLGIHFHHLTLLWTGRILAGFFAGNLTLCLAVVSDLTRSKKQRSKYFGTIASIGGLGFVFAIFAGGSLSNPNLASWFRPEIPFFITSALSAINLLLMIRFFEESRENPHDKIAFADALHCIGKALFNPHLRLVYIVYFLFMLAWLPSLQFLSAYLIDLFQVKRNTITSTFVAIGATWFCANFLVYPLLSKWMAPKKILRIALTFLSLFFALTLIPKEPLFLVVTHFLIASFFAAFCWTSGLNTLSSLGSSHMQGSILGVNQSLVAIASIVGPIIGALFVGIDIHRLYFFTASCALAGALLLFIQAFGIKKA